MAVADRGGLTQVSMRNVGHELGVEAMSLYHHLDAKAALLDRLADWVFTRIDLPPTDAPWRPAMTVRAASARRALAAHPWALGLAESRRAPGPALLRHHDAVLGCLRSNGFPLSLAAHAFSAVDAYVYGFVLTEVSLSFDPDEGAEALVLEVQDVIPAPTYPHLFELLSEHVMGTGYAYGDEFEFGLALVLDGLEAHLARAPRDGRGASPTR